jgi:hypothetical protein
MPHTEPQRPLYVGLLGSQVKLEAIIPQMRVEEPMWLHAESLLIGHHKGDHVPIHSGGECRVLRHTASLQLRTCHEPVLHKFLQVA